MISSKFGSWKSIEVRERKEKETGLGLINLVWLDLVSRPKPKSIEASEIG